MHIIEADTLNVSLKGPQEILVAKPGGEVQGLCFLSKNQDVSLQSVE